MRRVFILIGLLLVALPVSAQTSPEPDYTAFHIARLPSDDGTQVEAEFLVSNQGAAATLSASVELRALGQDTLLTTREIPPLANGGTHSLLLVFPFSAFPDVVPETETVVFELTILSPEFETVRLLSDFTLPAAQAVPGQPAQPPPVTDAPQPPAALPGESDLPLAPVLQPLEDFINDQLTALPFPAAVDLSDNVQLAAVMGGIAVLVVLLWLVLVIIRLIFVPRPTFPPNPAPYTGMPPMNPDSLPGRRQMWQQVAQHGSMLAEDTEGNLHARKLLTDTAGVRYSGWKVVGLRASQYDTYGRVARTQVIAPRRILRRLNRATDRATDLTEKAVQRRVRPAAQYMARQLGREINKRGAALPVALDVKLKGEHGEVNIVFELYQFQLGAWRRLDSWQPDMTVPGKSIHEMYTYTIHGLHNGETMRHFRKRLRNDMTYLLTEMVLCTPPATAPAPGTAASIRSTVQTQTNLQAAATTDEMGHTQQSQPPVSFAKTTQTSLRPVPPPDDDTSRGEGDPANGAAASLSSPSDDSDDASVFDTVPNPTNNNHNP
jgi:hypothetical protein